VSRQPAKEDDPKFLSGWWAVLEDKRIVGTDIATVEFGWPVGMPEAELDLAVKRQKEVESGKTSK
jgi:hypothetical protein